jgi:drug/metabolite transporter (DMT)-like permease
MSPLVSGTAFALAAGLMWGLVFVAPLMLPQYPPALLAVGRYLAFGLLCLPLAMLDRAELRRLSRADWLDAVKLTLVGNFLYYVALAAAIQRAGNPLVSVIIGTLPVVIAISSNQRNAARDGHLPWRRLAPSLGLIGIGIACVNQTEFAQLAGGGDTRRYLEGAAIALIALGAWTWYPIRNADWLRAHPDRNPRAWATAQGLVTLPIALLGLALMPWLVPAGFALPLGPEPLYFIGLMLAIGLFASWGGTLCWNEASQRLPTTLVGQLIVFETLAALAYGYLLRGQAPAWLAVGGIALLIAGVVWALRVKPVAVEGAH